MKIQIIISKNLKKSCHNDVIFVSFLCHFDALLISFWCHFCVIFVLF